MTYPFKRSDRTAATDTSGKRWSIRAAAISGRLPNLPEFLDVMSRRGGIRRILAIAVISLLASGCGSFYHKPVVVSQVQHPKKIAIFFDGTNNDAESDTNIKKLHALISLQDRSDIATLYIEGVGVGSDVLGMGTGLGIGARVRLAYEFLLDNYEKGDEVYIFGFSRGAYGARILTSLIYHAGLAVVGSSSDTPYKSKTNGEIAELVYDTVKVRYPPCKEPERQRIVKEALLAQGIQYFRRIDVQVLGLWDTVEALGEPDWGSKILHKMGVRPYKANIDNPNARYGDKLCNVHYAFHALAIDDNREWVFTPLPLMRRHLFDGCSPGDKSPLLDPSGTIQPRKLREVWFSGAHSDVGGGYPDSLLSGVSLNWMINRLNEFNFNLLPKNAGVPEDVFGTSHNPDSGLLGQIYHGQSRDPIGYARDERARLETRGKITVHSSVIARRAFIQPKSHELQSLTFQSPGTVCITEKSSDQTNSGLSKMWKETAPAACRSTIELLQDPVDSRGGT